MDAEHLASPYLRDILAKGKKFRLQQDVGTVLQNIKEGIQGYVDHKKKKKRDDQAYHLALDAWARAVVTRAQGKLAEAVKKWPQEPDGYPGLRQ